MENAYHLDYAAQRLTSRGGEDGWPVLTRTGIRHLLPLPVSMAGGQRSGRAARRQVARSGLRDPRARSSGHPVLPSRTSGDQGHCSRPAPSVAANHDFPDRTQGRARTVLSELSARV